MERTAMLLLILIFLGCSIFAQENKEAERPSCPVDIRGREALYRPIVKEMVKMDTVKLRIQYLTRNRETMEDSVTEDMEALYIGNQISEFRENTYQYGYEHLPEGLRPNESMPLDSAKMIDGAARKIRSKYRMTNYTIQKNVPEPGLQTCYYNLNPDDWNVVTSNSPHLFYEEPTGLMDWDLTEGDTTICGYVCQCATTSFRGRAWRALYTLDIPIQDGPWKLCGLPGLILKAEESKGDFSYEAVEIIRPHDEYIVKHPLLDRYHKSTFKRVAEVTELRYKNSETLFKLSIGSKMYEAIMREGYLREMNFSRKSRTPCLMELLE